MREILFRGKPKDKTDYYVFKAINWDNCENGFVFGPLIISKDKYYICVSEIFFQKTIINNGTASMTEVISETVGQYTGLTDKNGKKIFEGDILRFENADGEFSNYETIWFGNGWEVIQNGSQCADELDIFFCERSAVIGNIHDNPELLKENLK